MENRSEMFSPVVRTVLAGALGGGALGIWQLLLGNAGLSAMTRGEALSLLAVALGILASAGGKRFLTAALGSFILVLGARGMSPDMVGFPLPSAAALMVFGGVLVLLPSMGRFQAVWLGTGGGAVLAVVLSALLGRSTGVSPLYHWGHHAPYSVLSALGMGFLAVALLGLARQAERRSGRESWRWVVLPLLVHMVGTTLLMFQGLWHRDRGQVSALVEMRVAQDVERLAQRIESQVLPLRRMASRWHSLGRPSPQSWETESKAFMRHFPAYRAVAWFDGGYTRKWTAVGEEILVEDDIDFDMNSARQAALAALVADDRPWATRSKDLRQPGRVIQFHLPVHSPNGFDGFFVAQLHIESLLETVFQDSYQSGFTVTFLNGNDILYERSEGVPVTSFRRRRSLDWYGLDGTLELAPNRSYLRRHRSLLPETVLTAGLFLSLLIAFLVHLSQKLGERARELEKVNDYLAASEEQTRRQSLELMEAREAALTASRHKSEFLANMSHEIRTPLNAVVGLSELLSSTKLGAKQGELVKGIRSSSMALIALINDILDFSKIEANRLDLELADFELAKWVEGAREMFAAVARKDGVRLTFHLDDSAPKWVRGDAQRLRQVLVNLVSNAVKFTPEGEVAVYVGGRELGDGRVRLDVEVADTGIGMSQEEIGRLFQSFSQGDSSTTRRFGGTGLGLAISRRLVELMGGSITVESEKGRGSSFAFHVYLQCAAKPQRVARSRKKKKGAKSKVLTILVAEDNAMNQKVIRLLLEKLGARVELAENGVEVLKKWRRLEPDMVLLDCQMPGMDGYEAAEEIRKAETKLGRRRTPIIALSAHAMASDKQRCLASGMDDYLAKPVSIEELARSLDHWSVASKAPSKGKGSEVESSPDAVAEELPVIDRSVLFSLRLLEGEGSTGFVTDLVTLFRDTTPLALEALETSAGAGDWEGVAREAHKLKSGCANLGAARMVALCESLESAGSEGALGQARVTSLIEELGQEFQQALSQLESEGLGVPGKVSRAA